MLKLSDFLNPQTQTTGLARMRCLKNSIKRNIMFPSVGIKKSQAITQYETKINGMHFQNKDLILLFQHLYSKEQMEIGDRNLIRRILLTLFPQELIVAGGKKMVMYTMFVNKRKGEKFYGTNMFYLLMKGDIKLQSPFYQKSITSGDYFGHLELLTSSPEDSFIAKVQSDSSLICISTQGFIQTLSHYFLKSYQPKQSCLPRSLTQKLQPLQLLLILQQMSKSQYSIGQKISKKGDNIQQIFFQSEGKLCDNIEMEPYKRKFKVDCCVGLIQIMLGSKMYMFDNFVVEECKGYVVGVGVLAKYVGKDGVESKMTSSFVNQSFNEKSNQRSKTQISTTAQKKIQLQLDCLRKFMRVRKVNLPFLNTKSPKSESNISTQLTHNPKERQSPHQHANNQRYNLSNKYETNFIFIKDNKIQTPQRSKQARINRSFSLLREQPQTVQFKRYLEYVQVPSFSKFGIGVGGDGGDGEDRWEGQDRE